ncbi:formyl peptide receptor 2-like [Pseudophryne corroboree]|uniref:formyl peptide receptor 2-like n=1 Tax=Pseudophryne corroboree TaxID=495146 RepID=UPI00308120F2
MEDINSIESNSSNEFVKKETVDMDAHGKAVMKTPFNDNGTITPTLENRTLYNMTVDYSSTDFTEDTRLNSNFTYDDNELDNLIDFIRTMSIIWYSVTLILGIVGNGLVIWIAGFRMKTVSAVWFVHLAIADFVTCISLPLRISDWALYWQIPYDNYLCRAGITILFINMLSSVYFMTVISIDRCVSIIFPIWTKSHRTPRLATIIAILVWLLTLLSSIPYLVFNHGVDDVTECFPKYDLPIESNLIMKTNAMYITRNVCMFSFPFVIILISYGLIFIKIRRIKKSKRFQRPFRVITSVIVCFFICWFPYNTWPLISFGISYSRTDIVITEVSICLAYFSSCINPLLYVFFSHDFKKRFVKSIPAILETAFNERSDLNCMDTPATTFKAANLDSSL